jgi:hypothetical protein
MLCRVGCKKKQILFVGDLFSWYWDEFLFFIKIGAFKNFIRRFGDKT